MANLNQEKHFKIIKNHEKMEVKFLRTTTVDTKIDLIKKGLSHEVTLCRTTLEIVG